MARGLISEADLTAALTEQKKSGQRLGDILIAIGRITPVHLVDALSERLGIPKIGIDGLIADPDVVNIIPLRISKKHRVVAFFKIQDRLTVAMADPLDMVAIDEIRYQTGLTVNRVIATPAEIDEAIARFYSVADNVERVIYDSSAKTAATGGQPSSDDAPIVRLVEVLLTEAVKQKASDLHIEPHDNSLRVRFRVDGVLREVAQPPAQLHPAIVSRIKVMSEMDVSEKRIPQDGRAHLLSDPRVTVLENQRAQMKVTTTYPVQTLSRFTEGRIIQDIVEYQDLEVGITLTVIPRLNTNGQVTLEVVPVVEEVTGFTGVPGNERPITANRTVKTFVRVGDGETLVIDGLVRETDFVTESSVFLLGDIPVLGALFKHRKVEQKKQDLLIFITPKILPG